MWKFSLKVQSKSKKDELRLNNESQAVIQTWNHDNRRPLLVRGNYAFLRKKEKQSRTCYHHVQHDIKERI